MHAVRPGWASIRVAVLLVLLGAGGAAAGEISVIRLDGAVFTGRPAAGNDGLVLESPAGPRTLDWDDVLLVAGGPEKAAKAPPPAADEFEFALTDSSVVRGVIAGVNQDRLDLKLTNGRAGTVPAAALGRIRALRYHPSAASGARAPEDSDHLIVLGAKEALSLSGAWKGVDAQGVHFQYKERDRLIPWDKLGEVRALRPATRSGAFQLKTRDGQVFVGSGPQGDERRLRLETELFGAVEVPWAEIEQLSQSSAQVVFLSDLEPRQVQAASLFGKKWEVAFDRTFSHQPIRLGGQTLPRGVCMHAKARVSFMLGGAGREFAAQAGILDEMEQRGCATLRVLGDGRVLWEGERVRGGQPPRNVLVNVEGVKELTLEADYGDELDLSDQVCWGLARVLR